MVGRWSPSSPQIQKATPVSINEHTPFITYRRLRRAAIAGIASLFVYGLARVVADTLYDPGSYSLANLIFFLGSPALLLTVMWQGATASLFLVHFINGAFWFITGGMAAFFVKRTWLVILIWLCVAVASVVAGLVWAIAGMVSSSP